MSKSSERKSKDVSFPTANAGKDSIQEPSGPVTSPAGDPGETHPVATGDRFKKPFCDLSKCAPGYVCRRLGRALGVRDELNLTLWKEALTSRCKSSDLGICIRNSCGCTLAAVDTITKQESDNIPTAKKRDFRKAVKKDEFGDVDGYAYGADGLQFYQYLTKVERCNKVGHVVRQRGHLCVIKFGDLEPAVKVIVEISRERLQQAEMFRIEPAITEEEKELVNHNIAKKLEPRKFYFPWFITIFSIIQVIALIILLSVKGVEEIGLDPIVTIIQDVVTLRGTEQVDMWIRPNIWIGPPVAGLIEAGAVYGPCMRTDATISVILLSSMYRMGEPLGCCAVREHNVAATMTKIECSNGTSGGGQWDPKPCNNSVGVQHVLRPCCFGLLGSCKLTTETGCKAQHGTFHSDKKHCSEVFCFPSICGGHEMKPSRRLPFMPSTANQGWRFLVSFIYVAGILHLLLLLFFQWAVGRPIEAMVGPVRMCIVYLYASFGGNLVGCFMDPYLPQVGAGGGLTCLVAISLTEILQCRKELHGHFVKELLLILLLLLFIFIAGFAPLINNFCHLGGILFGLPVAFFLMPHLNFNRWNCKARKVIVAVSAVLIFIILLVFLLLFYLIQDTGICGGCYYFSCIPFTNHMCNVLVELIGTVSID